MAFLSVVTLWNDYGYHHFLHPKLSQLVPVFIMFSHEHGNMAILWWFCLLSCSTLNNMKEKRQEDKVGWWCGKLEKLLLHYCLIIISTFPLPPISSMQSFYSFIIFSPTQTLVYFLLLLSPSISSLCPRVMYLWVGWWRNSKDMLFHMVSSDYYFAGVSPFSIQASRAESWEKSI